MKALNRFLTSLVGTSKYATALTLTFGVFASADAIHSNFFAHRSGEENSTANEEDVEQAPPDFSAGFSGNRKIASVGTALGHARRTSAENSPAFLSPDREPPNTSSLNAANEINGSFSGNSASFSAKSTTASPSPASDPAAAPGETPKASTGAASATAGGPILTAGSSAGTATATATSTSTSLSITGNGASANPPAPLCPNNYVQVPFSSPLSSADFCIAKYEMKIQGNASGDQAYNAAFVAESRADGTPWVNLSRQQAAAACQALGTGYDLPTNAEWQTLARNLESVPWNWSNGAVGDSGGVSRSLGMNAGIAASTDDDPCSGTGNSCDLSTWNAYRRVHRLTTGQYIWDVAGNVAEWVANDWPVNSSYAGGNVAITQLTQNVSISAWSPSGNYSALNSEPYGGLGEAFGNSSTGSLARGGAWRAGSATLKDAGIFAANAGSVAPDNSIGFRCVYRPTNATTEVFYSPDITPVTPVAVDNSNVELGMKFQSSVNGSISAIRFYRGIGNGSGYTVNLWTNAGVNLATATGTDSVIPGWQEIALPSPVAISAGTTYVASYYTQGGQYAYSLGMFPISVSNSFHLTVPINGGVYNAGPGFPASVFGNLSYFVDIKFVPSP